MEMRLARRDDVPAVVALLADDQLGTQREAPADPLPEVYWRAFEAVDADPNNELAVLESGGGIVGCLQITYIPGVSRRGSWRAQIEGVRIGKAARGEGFGRQMIAWAIARARERGCALMQLTTDKRRGEAHRFYESLGFVASHEGMKLDLSRD